MKYNKTFYYLSLWRYIILKIPWFLHRITLDYKESHLAWTPQNKALNDIDAQFIL